MTKYRKGPQRTTREHRAGPQLQTEVIEAHLSWAPLNTAETAMETKHAAGPRQKSALTGSQSVRRGRPWHMWTYVETLFFVPVTMQKRRLAVADWKALSESQRQRVRLAVFCLIFEPRCCWHEAINIHWRQPDSPAPSRCC